MEEGPPRSAFEAFTRKVFYAFDAPVTWFRETVVLPNRKQNHYYYHRKYNRVPAIDECYENDVLCMFEANEQYKRDKQVESEIINILRQRKIECIEYEGPDVQERCKKIFDDYAKAELNFFIKYGDMGYTTHVKQAYMKQKHRMVYERRQAEKQDAAKEEET